MEVRNDCRTTDKEFKTLVKSDILLKHHNLSYDEIKSLIYEMSKQYQMGIEDINRITKEIYDDMFKLGLVQKYLDDDSINEIMINGMDPIIIEKDGIIIYTNDTFENLDTLNNVIQRIVSAVNRRVNASMPIVDARLEDGSRVNIVLPPIAVNGPIVTIRKFKEQTYTLDWYESVDILTKEANCLLKQLVKCKYNIFVSGGTSSGKTTFLNAMSDYIPLVERVITIEDSAELNLSNIKNLVSLETRYETSNGVGEIDVSHLIKCALRMRPDRIVVGEIRGSEALEMIHAMNTGHDGSLSTGHANSSRDMLSRIELMVLSNMELPIGVVRKLIGSSIDILIHLERNLQGKRYIKEINELLGYEKDYNINCLFRTEKNKLIQVNELIKTEKVSQYETF